METEGYTLARYTWESPEPPTAVLLIIHGMAEHCERYDHFATHLNDHNIIVYAHDHRGHGRSVPSDSELGHLGKGGFQAMVDDVDNHLLTIKETHPSLPIFVFAHSMGSFVMTEHLIQKDSTLSGVILSGSCGTPPLKTHFGRVVARLERLRKGGRGKSRLMEFLVFGDYNNHLENTRTKKDWISSVNSVVDDYISDPRCGFMLDNQFWVEFFDALYKKSDPTRQARIAKNLKMLLVSGTECPVGLQTIGVKRLIAELTKAGIRDLKYIFYPKMRHEIINEVVKNTAYEDILEWIEKLRQND